MLNPNGDTVTKAGQGDEMHYKPAIISDVSYIHACITNLSYST